MRGYAPATVVYLASADSKYGGSFCDSTGVPAASEPEKVPENPWVSFSHRLQYGNNRFATRDIRKVMLNQVLTPAGLMDTESERRYQMSDQLTFKGRF